LDVCPDIDMVARINHPCGRTIHLGHPDPRAQVSHTLPAAHNSPRQPSGNSTRIYFILKAATQLQKLHAQVAGDR
jgi:hypothetical protein